MDFTPEQRAAIFTHDRNLIVTAGAGSGKTRVLVARFMALLDAHPDWTLPGMVAITFTEKAAREMRDRVRAALDDRIRAAVVDGDGAALDRWLEHQATLNSARIGTIHSLCARILRANPAEAEIDPAFEVLDENEAAILLDDAVEMALARLVQTDDPAAALLVAYGVRTVRDVLREYALAGAAAGVAEALSISPGDLLRRWEDAWRDAIRDVMAGVRVDGDLRDALAWIRPADLPDDRLSEVWRIVHAHTGDLLEGDPAAFAVAVETLATEIRINVGSAKNWGGKEIVDEAKTVLKVIRERMQKAQADMLPRPGEVDEAAAEWLFWWGETIRLAVAEYANLKAERNALDFDDLEARTRDLLNDYPHVAARYRGEFRHVLVDEFQDTNAAQRDIIYRLSGVGEPGADGRLFVVGDPKQSIYAFRGADVSVFGAVRDDLIAWGGAELPLSTSFRAHERLVEAYNDVFGHILGAGEGPAARYEVDLGQPMVAFRPAEPHHAAPVTVLAFQRPDPDIYPDWRSADDIRRWEAWELAQHIHGLVRGGVPIWDRDRVHESGQGTYRPIDYGDVALLFQAMTRAPLYEEVFKAAGLPYVTVAGKGYYDRQEVWDLLNLLRALHNPADDLALATALRSPLFGLSDDALFALRLVRDENRATVPLWKALFLDDVPFFPAEDHPARDFARAVLGELRDLAGRASIAELLARALNRTGYLATLTGLPDGARRRGNVEKLLTLAQESGRVSLGAFNAYARELTAREVREGEAAIEAEGAVTLMSVHASKGLEFPVVVLADAAWERRGRGGVFTLDPDAGAACALPSDDPDSEEPEAFVWAWAKSLDERRDRAERRRLLYVGATRAQDYLIVSGSLYRAGEHTWLRQWLAALGVTDDDRAVLDDQMLSRAWGECVIRVPDVPPSPDDLTPRVTEEVSGWDDPAVAAGQVIAGIAPQLPPLLAEIVADPQAPARALTATQIAKLGRAPYYDPTARGYGAFRHSVLHDAPEPVRPLPEPRADDRRLRVIVGEMVHRALQAWLLPDNTDPDGLRGWLETVAWQEGVSDPAQAEIAVTRALDLLRRFGDSDVRAQLDRAEQVYRELPFVYHTGTRAIHGVIDVLFFDRHTWHVLDYKTATVSFGRALDNARCYYLQVGVYAAAVEAKTGQAPEAYLYYIHPGRLVTIRSADWQDALARLEDDIRAALDPRG